MLRSITLTHILILKTGLKLNVKKLVTSDRKVFSVDTDDHMIAVWERQPMNLKETLMWTIFDLEPNCTGPATTFSSGRVESTDGTLVQDKTDLSAPDDSFNNDPK